MPCRRRRCGSAVAASSIGFSRKSTAPFCTADTAVGMLPWAERKMIGSLHPISMSLSWISGPVRPGIRTSSTMQPGRDRSSLLRNRLPLVYAAVSQPIVSSKSPKDPASALSSSTMRISGRCNLVLLLSFVCFPTLVFEAVRLFGSGRGRGIRVSTTGREFVGLYPNARRRTRKKHSRDARATPVRASSP